jgi:AcrR family transcriptional regulator
MVANGVQDVEDGRRIRRDRNRDAVVDAMISLYDEGNLAPSADDISDRAGLSARSLFRYFEDIDDLCRAAITHQLQRVRPTLNVSAEPDDALSVRIAAVVDQRLRMFDAIGSVGHVSRLRAPFQPLVAAELRQARSFLRHQLERCFAAELAAMPEHMSTSVLAIADVVCSFEAYQLLRQDQQLSQARAGDALADALSRLFASSTVER